MHPNTLRSCVARALAFSGLCLLLTGLAAGCSSQSTAPALPANAASTPPQGGGTGATAGAAQPPSEVIMPGAKAP